MDSVPNTAVIQEQCAAESGFSLEDLLARYPGHEEHVARVWLAARATEPSPAVRHPNGLVGPYERLHVIGRGVQGEVYLARDTRSRRTVALKILAGTPTPQAIARLRHEAQAIARLRHPAIAEVLDAEFDGPVPYLAMRHVDGVVLRDVRAATACPVALFATPDRPLPPGSLRWFEQLARAVHAAHEAGVVHADLHPGNLMVAANGNPVVLDFGTAKVEGLASVTLTGLAIGSARFAAPEVLRGRRADRRSDVFSLGALIVDCLSLTPAGTDLSRAMVGIGDRALRTVVQKAFAVHAVDRFATALELAEELRRIRVGAPIRTGHPGPIGRAVRWVTRNPLPFTATLLLTTLLVAALSTWRDTLQARHRSDDAAARGRALLAGLADEWGAQRVTELLSGGTAATNRAADGELAAGVETEVGRLLRHAGHLDVAQRHIDLAAGLGGTLPSVEFEQALLAFDRGAPVVLRGEPTQPPGAFVAGLRALQAGDVDTAMTSMRHAVARDDWPMASLRTESLVLAAWLALDEGHAGADEFLADVPFAEPTVFGALARLVRGRALLRGPGQDAEAALATLRRARAELARKLGDEHGWVLRAERAVAMALVAHGEDLYAGIVCEGLAPRQAAIHGAGHPEVVRTRLLEWNCKRRVFGAEATAALAEGLAAIPRTPANRRLFDRALEPEATPPEPLDLPAPDRHLANLEADYASARAQLRELERQFDALPPAVRDEFMRDRLRPFQFGVEFPAHAALDRARWGEGSEQHLSVLLTAAVAMGHDHWQAEALQVARRAMAIVLRHRDTVDPITARLVECWFVRWTVEARSVAAGGVSVLSGSQDLLTTMREAVQDLRSRCAADDERFQSAVKSFADLLGNEGGPDGAAEAMELYDELRRANPRSASHAIWCAEAALGCGAAERLRDYLHMAERLLGERPAHPDFRWDRLDELRQGLAGLRAPTAAGR